MALVFSDQDIEALVQELKPMPNDWRQRIRPRPKRGHNERHLDLNGDAGTEFQLILRQSQINVLDFSIILAVRIAKSTQLFRLRRYNGKSHEHTNIIENVTFFDFHIHFATERYQDVGTREDAFAESTDRYSDIHGAIQCLIDDANLEVPFDPQSTLF